MKLEVKEYLPEGNIKAAYLLFVHGAYHGAWCWEENFLPYFSSKGFSSYSFSLRGHGESEGYEELDNFSLDDYVDDVLDTIKVLKSQPVLIGHSMGGAIVQKVLHKYPDRIKGIILVASVHPNAALYDLLRLIFKNYREAVELFSYSDNKRDASILSNLFLSNDLLPEKRDRYISLLQPESLKARKEMGRKIIPIPIRAKVPMLIIGSKKDRMISERTTRNIGKIYKTEPIIFTNICHDMMLDPNWEKVANLILTFLNESVCASEERRYHETTRFISN